MKDPLDEYLRFREQRRVALARRRMVGFPVSMSKRRRLVQIESGPPTPKAPAAPKWRSNRASRRLRRDGFKDEALAWKFDSDAFHAPLGFHRDCVCSGCGQLIRKGDRVVVDRADGRTTKVFDRRCYKARSSCEDLELCQSSVGLGRLRGLDQSRVDELFKSGVGELIRKHEKGFSSWQRAVEIL